MSVFPVAYPSSVADYPSSVADYCGGRAAGLARPVNCASRTRRDLTGQANYNNRLPYIWEIPCPAFSGTGNLQYHKSTFIG